MIESEKNRLGTMPVIPLVIYMAVPVILQMAVQSLYNIADSMFLSRYSTSVFASVCLLQPLLLLIAAVASGTGVGLSSCLSRRMGSGDEKGARHILGGSYCLMVWLSVLIPITSFVLYRPLMHFLSVSGPLLEEGRVYAFILFAGFPLLLSGTLFSYLLQAQSFAKESMWSQSVGCITNIVMDPILIFTCGLGAVGAALATVMGYLVSAVLAGYLFHRKSSIHAKRGDFRLSFQFIRDVYAVGIPSFVSQGASSVVGMALNTLVLSYGVGAMSVYGMYLKTESFMFLSCFGLNSALVSIVGYNYGAKRPLRVKHATIFCIVLGEVLMLLGFLLFQFFAPTLVRIFTDEPQLIAEGAIAFRRLSFCFLLTSPHIIFMSLCQGIGKGWYGMVTTNVRFLLFVLPFAYFLSHFYGVNGLWFCYFAADLAIFPLVLFLYFYVWKRYILTC